MSERGVLCVCGWVGVVVPSQAGYTRETRGVGGCELAGWLLPQDVTSTLGPWGVSRLMEFNGVSQRLMHPPYVRLLHNASGLLHMGKY